MDQHILRVLLQEKLADGRLPHARISHIRGGRGNGETCDGCGETVTAAQTLMENLDTTGRVVRLHVGCFYLWDAQRQQYGNKPGAPASHGSWTLPVNGQAVGPAEPWMPRAGRTSFWAIVLAGGEGVRLRPLVRRALGDERPKQYVPLLGERTLLGQTLDRVGIGIPFDRTIVVTMQRHAEYAAEEFGADPHHHLLAQPEDRGTAAAILTPVHQIARKDPAAVVAVFPSDHYIPCDARFMAAVAEVGVWVDANPDRMVLLGVKPTSPEVEYGWIEPGEPIGEVTTGPLRTVRQFWEKPVLSRAKLCLAAGHLWNTSVVIGTARAFLRAGREGTSDLMDALADAESLIPIIGRTEALQRAYGRMPKANFSRAVLEACPHVLAVARLPRLVWSDLGNPRRVMEVIAGLDTRPAWALG